ncbi:MAG TPA: WecB/TagA/CpsF family glycosyltransferase [Dehalococcoidia bacterium]|nr:WecB/TagA/CpsF family glycosyltransferase [Dehalococcoidia bacterium]
MRRASLLGVRIDLASRRQALELVGQRLRGPNAGLLWVVTVNAECLAIAAADPGYRRAINGAGLNLVDGAGVALALALKGMDAVERLPGAELVWDLAATCAAEGARLFLLGATRPVLAEAMRRLRQRFPGLAVEGLAPPFSPSHQFPPPLEREALGHIRRFAPQVLCVALGMPKQELWCHEHLRRLEALGVRVAVGVGGALDYIAGRMPPPPRPVRALGLEWCYRLLREPHRRLGRQASRLPRFLVLALAEALRERLAPSTGRRPLC